MRNNQKLQNNKVVLLSTIIFVVTIIMTIGYAAFSDQLTITDTVAHVRVYKEVRINGVTTSSGSVSNLDYDSDSILNTVSIPAGESVTYSVTATNLGSVPVAVSAISFTNGNGTVSNLSADIPSNSNGYLKICDTNDACTGGVSKTFDITITNTGSSMISTNLDVNLTFTEVYDISYEKNKIGEALKGSTYTKTFDSPAPAKLVKTSGTCDSFDYTNNTLIIINVGSNLDFTEAHTITYNGENQGYIANGGTYTYTFESQWPATIVKESGTSGNLTYDAFQTHTITIPNVTSDIVLTGTIGKVEIKSINYVEGSAKNVLDNPIPNPTFHDMDAQFSITFQRPEGSTETDFEITYEVTISNTHYDDYIFRGLDFNPQITASADSDTAELSLIPIGIDDGEKIASGATKTFQVKLVLTTNNPDGNYSTATNTQVDTTPDTEEETGAITATINKTSGNLQTPNTLAPFTVTVTSTYPSDKEFRLISSNSNLEIVDANGNAISRPLTIHGESTKTYQINVKIAEGANFVSNSTTMSMYLSSEGIANTSVDTLTLAVDKYDVPDTTKVTVGNLQLAYYYDKSDSTPKIKATWDRKDVGGTAISDYVVNVYTTNGNVAKTCHTSSATRECLISGLSENTNYYAVVYGIDEAGNSGASDVGSATQADGYATRSSTESWTWTYTVTRNLTNMTVSSGGTTAIKGSSYILVFTADDASSNNYYAVPDSMTVTMANSSGNFYTYQKENSDRRGRITINEVTGNISISGSRTGSGVCLVEGTKVKLYDGTYKNIEDIKYYDLLSVWSYDTGSLTYEYPIWIEKSNKSDSYQKTTFSDGTILKTVGLHQVFSLDDNKFVNIYDENGYIKVGTRVAKEVDGKIVPIKVTKVETVNENVNYYYIASSIYYNIITEDIITTSDQIVPGVTLSNMYGFDDNIKWPSNRKEIISKEGALYNYKDLNVMPYYLYYGSRGNETKLFVNLGYATTPELINYLLATQLNPDKAVSPITDKEGNRLWMITTSDDDIKNYKKYLHKEGYIYTLKEPKSVKNKEFVGLFNTESYVYALKKPTSVKNKEFVGWFNTVDGKMYKVGEKYKLIHGTHFIAIYK